MIVKTVWKPVDGIEVKFSSKVYAIKYDQECGMRFLLYLSQNVCDEIYDKLREEYEKTMSEGRKNGDVIDDENGKIKWRGDVAEKCELLVSEARRYLKAHFVCQECWECEMEEDDDIGERM
jgi:DNA-directed RNA polymerase specialized sigma subunit